MSLSVCGKLSSSLSASGATCAARPDESEPDLADILQKFIRVAGQVCEDRERIGGVGREDRDRESIRRQLALGRTGGHGYTYLQYSR